MSSEMLSLKEELHVVSLTLLLDDISESAEIGEYGGVTQTFILEIREY